jgi:hypothetical protein
VQATSKTEAEVKDTEALPREARHIQHFISSLSNTELGSIPFLQRRGKRSRELRKKEKNSTMKISVPYLAQSSVSQTDSTNDQKMTTTILGMKHNYTQEYRTKRPK